MEIGCKAREAMQLVQKALQAINSGRNHLKGQSSTTGKNNVKILPNIIYAQTPQNEQ